MYYLAAVVMIMGIDGNANIEKDVFGLVAAVFKTLDLLSLAVNVIGPATAIV